MNALPRVYVVDDDEAMRRVITRLLQAEYDVMSFAAASHFLDVAATLTPGCLILDVYMPDISGLEVQRELFRRHLHFPTIVITGLGEVSIAVEAMKAGAIDFIEKPFRGETIIECVRQAQQHCTAVVAGDDGEAARAHLDTLSPRELQVLDGLVAGLPNKTIGYDLGLSPRTVEVHRANIMKKMAVNSLSALVRRALAAGVQVKG